MRDEYTIIDDFQVKQMRVLVLDSDYEFGKFNRVLIDGQDYLFTPNSIMNWIAITSTNDFKGKTAKFVHIDEERQ